MNRFAKILIVLAASLFILMGCGNKDELDSFTLEAIDLSGDDEANPTWYFVNRQDAPGQVVIIKRDLSEPGVIASDFSEYELEATSVTEDEIIISFEDETHQFERLSQTVAENDDKVRYHYRSTEPD